MRYFLLIFFLTGVLVVGMAGFRGGLSRKPPVELFPDMDRQPKVRPQEPNQFFPDGNGSRLPVAGTVARSKPFVLAAATGKREVYPFEDAPVNNGKVSGTTNFVATNPFEINQDFMARGRDRFQIFCAPCHGALADGNGVPKKLGAMAVVANLHDPRILKMADGEIFTVITNGKGLMGTYAPQVDIADRWAIIAYLRALQLSRLGTIDDVPENVRSTLKK